MSFHDLENGRVIGGIPPKTEMDSTQAVASGIFQINTALFTFQRYVNTLGTPKDTPELREKLQKMRLHIGQLVKNTSLKLKQETESDHQTEVTRSKKIADAKLAKDFQAVLKEFQKAQRFSAQRETMYTPFTKPHQFSEHKTSDNDAILDESKRQKMVLLENEIAFNEAIIGEREQGIREIEQQIGEVNEIFKDLAVLVHDQGAMIDDIGSQISHTHAAVSHGKSHLKKGALNQRSNSSLSCLLLVIFGISLLIIFVLLKA